MIAGNTTAAGPNAYTPSMMARAPPPKGRSPRRRGRSMVVHPAACPYRSRHARRQRVACAPRPPPNLWRERGWRGATATVEPTLDAQRNDVEARHAQPRYTRSAGPNARRRTRDAPRARHGCRGRASRYPLRHPPPSAAVQGHPTSRAGPRR
eukprot:7390986-Prymnesium_polylepis.1